MKEKIKKIWLWIVLLFCVFMFVGSFIQLIFYPFLSLFWGKIIIPSQSITEIIVGGFWLIASGYGILKFQKKLNILNLLKKQNERKN